MNDEGPKRRANAYTWNEADTCRKFVVPKLQTVGWDNEPHSIAAQRTFTDGRIVVRGNQTQRQKPKRADCLLRYTRDFLLAVVEAKADYKKAADGLQQAKEYAEILDLKFAHATNGRESVEFSTYHSIAKEASRPGLYKLNAKNRPVRRGGLTSALSLQHLAFLINLQSLLYAE